MDSSLDVRIAKKQIGPDVEAAIGDTSCGRWVLVPGEDSCTGNVTGGRKVARYVLEVAPPAERVTFRPDKRVRPSTPQFDHKVRSGDPAGVPRIKTPDATLFKPKYSPILASNSTEPLRRRPCERSFVTWSRFALVLQAPWLGKLMARMPSKALAALGEGDTLLVTKSSTD